MIDGSEKRKRQLVFEFKSSRVYEKRSTEMQSKVTCQESQCYDTSCIDPVGRLHLGMKTFVMEIFVDLRGDDFFKCL